MCGISGYIDLNKGVNKDILKNMTDMIAYRGPDDEGFSFFSEKDVKFARGKDTVPDVQAYEYDDIVEIEYFMGFGHRRLSILDLSVLGHQPMMKHNKVLTYNGEIYNYIELRQELQNYGYTFISNCDSEVILSAYDYWGDKCVEKFNGMWAFAIYDFEKKELFLSRDRFGVKPLYYYSSGEKLIFASEIKQILCDKFVPRIVNEKILAHHLNYNCRDYSEETFFEDIHVLRGGCNMKVSFDFVAKRIKSLNVYRYYDLSERIKVKQYDNSNKEIGDALRHAINIRTRSDVKLGSCLSGGLDSSSIVGIVTDEKKHGRINADKLTTVTIGFPNDRKINETGYAHQVAEYCGCEEHLITPDVDDMMNHLENMVWHQDEPLPHLGMEVSYSVFKAASDYGCEVFFDGQGGDEGLTGYYYYYANYLCDTLKKDGIADFIKRLKEVVNSSDLGTLNAIIYVLYFTVPFFRNFGVEIRRNRYLGKSLKKAVNKKDIEFVFKQNDGLGRQIDDYLYISLPGILHWEDRNSMASSVETRLPFLDYEYVEKVLSVDVMEKLKGGYTKAPLRQYMKGMLPDEVIWRKSKFGFPAPSERWLWEMPQEYVLDLFNNAHSKKYFNIDRLKKDYLNKQSKAADMIGKFILVELWMRKFEMRSK